MTYTELKAFDLTKLTSQDTLTTFKTQVLAAESEDILRYLNYLRWEQYHGSNTRAYLTLIMRFLAEDDIWEIERAHPELITGQNEDLIFEVAIPDVPNANPVVIVAPSFTLHGTLQTALEDDFERVLVVLMEGVLKAYGTITDQGVNYIYELPESNQEYLQRIIDAPAGTKINLRAYHQEEEILHKTYTIIEVPLGIYEGIEFQMTRKTPVGILSPTVAGVYSVLKSQTLFSSESLFKDEIRVIREDLQARYDKVLEKIKASYEEVVLEYKEMKQKEAFNHQMGHPIPKPVKTPAQASFHDKIMGAFKFDPNAEERADKPLIPGMFSDEITAEIEADKQLATENEPAHDCGCGGCGGKCASGDHFHHDHDEDDETKIYMPQELIFAVHTTFEDLGPCVSFTPKDYWEEFGHCADFLGGHNIDQAALKAAGLCGAELAESIFEVLDLDASFTQIKADCEAAGFIYSPEFQNFLDTAGEE